MHDELSRIHAAAIDMAAVGLTDMDIGAAFGLDPAAVRRLLAAPTNEAAALHARAWRQAFDPSEV